MIVMLRAVRFHDYRPTRVERRYPSRSPSPLSGSTCHVDSMWQCDMSEFRMADVGRSTHVTGFTDDRSRFRVMSAACLRKSANEANLRLLVVDEL